MEFKPNTDFIYLQKKKEESAKGGWINPTSKEKPRMGIIKQTPPHLAEEFPIGSEAYFEPHDFKVIEWEGDEDCGVVHYKLILGIVK